MNFIKYDDFVLWVTDPESHTPAAVVPVAPRGAGVRRVRVAWATPGTTLQHRRQQLRDQGTALEVGPEDSLTQQAFAKQR